MTVFHPTDFSQPSHTAFRHALRMAFGMGTGLTIMHVGDGSQSNDWSRFPHIRNMLAQWGLVEPGISPEELQPLTGLRVTKISAAGSNPVDVMADYLREQDVTVIVMATRGRTGIAALQQPSVSRALVRRVRRPMLFVRDGIKGFVDTDGSVNLDHVLVPVDNEPDPQMAIDASVRLHQQWNIPVKTLEALHVGERKLHFPLVVPDLSNTELKSVSREGSPEQVIPTVAQENRANLIVMAYSGPDRLSEKWLGSTTEQVIKTAPCPVLTLPDLSYKQG